MSRKMKSILAAVTVILAYAALAAAVILNPPGTVGSSQ